MTSRHTDRCKAVFLKGMSVVMVRDCAGYGESKLVAEMGLSEAGKPRIEDPLMEFELILESFNCLQRSYNPRSRRHMMNQKESPVKSLPTSLFQREEYPSSAKRGRGDFPKIVSSQVWTSY